MYCFDTDILSTVLKRNPPLPLIRRLAQIRPEEQFTTSITLGELLFGAYKKGSDRLLERVRDVVLQAAQVLPFDELAAETYGPLRADLESTGTPLNEPDLRIASIVLSRDLILVTANVRHFERIPGLRIENWIT
jgi:predicted nucleic acid-binding protein